MSSGAEIAPKNPDLINIDSEDIYSVTELSQNIKQVFSTNSQFNDIVLKGEIFNFNWASSGHIYFSLKDENCVIACAFFKHLQTKDCGDLGEGIQVLAMGSVTCYEPRSQYQLNIKKIITIGDGIYSLKLKRLRDKLEGEGLFSQDRKKHIPSLPRKVGIVTSKDSAAIKDILSVVNLRFPKMNLVMAYATLQGDGAPQSIIQALSRLTKAIGVDTIILARGGGPSEDFKAFNDEGLVRAIASSAKPIITGIGHEEDMCLADLAADFRASTPSTAARAAIPDISELRNGLISLGTNLDRAYSSYLMGLKIREKEAEIGKKDRVIKETLEVGRSDILKYKVAVVALITLLVLIILIFMLKG
jgi:exodeoxyribonuclease VII large subunit